MPSFDFPASPVINQTYTANGITYTYNGTYWKQIPTNLSTVGLPVLYEYIATGSPTTITISNIPQMYRHLKIVINARSTAVATAANLSMVFNSDTGANYMWKRSTTDSGTASNNSDTSIAQIAEITASSAPANYCSGLEITIPNYSSTAFYKNAFSQFNFMQNTTGSVLLESAGGFWKSTATINTIAFALAAGAFADGSTVTVYGVGGATAQSGSNGGGASIWLGTTAPSNPFQYPLWWKSDEGIFLTYYYDGSSYQWVATNPAPVQSGAPPLTTLQKTTTQSTTSGTWATISWDTTPIEDTVGAFSSATPTQITVPVGYTRMRATFYGYWTTNTAGLRGLHMLKNGVSTAAVLYAPDVDVNVNSLVTRWYTVSPGDILKFEALQTSGGALTFGNGASPDATPYVQIEWSR